MFWKVKSKIRLNDFALEEDIMVRLARRRSHDDTGVRVWEGPGVKLYNNPLARVKQSP